MWRSKKLIISAVLAAVVLVGSIGGVVLADDGDADNQPEAQFDALLDRTAAVYQEKTGTALDIDALKESFNETRNEMRIEALQERLQAMVDEGKITQEQADEYLEWQQARPDVPFGFGQRGPGGPGKFRGRMGGCFGGFGRFAPEPPASPAQ